MTAEEFLTQPEPGKASRALQALWHDAHGHWEKAHALAQEDGSRDGDWVHAYLHRVEGDAANAAYWYRRAGRAVAVGPLAVEWHTITTELLAR